MKKRLQQFFDFGHNCAIMGLTADQAQQVLEDNRFDVWAITEEEKRTFQKGLHTEITPGEISKPIDIRPIIWTHNHKSDQRHRYVRVADRKQIQNENRSRTAIEYWSSVEGLAAKKRIGDLTRARHAKKRLAKLEQNR